MATVVLQVAGAAVGGFLGGPAGAAVGRALGAAAGYSLDQKLFSKDQFIEGGRVENARVLSSGEGETIPRVYGRARLGGKIIWATRFKEVRSTTTKQSGGKGGGPSVTTESFSYFANFAVGICEGEVSHIGRIWADGAEVDQTAFEIRTYNGSETQTADPLIEAKQGLDNTPAFKGIAYAVFENFPIADYGNRIPQITFEVIKGVSKVDKSIKSICLIPGASEFAYSPQEISGTLRGTTISENRHVYVSASDWEASINELQAVCPNLESVALVVSWFGTDLRAGNCLVEPRVEHKDNNRGEWIVSGVDRPTANLTSRIDGRPAYGGTPSDATVIEAIRDLKSRGLKILFYPFIMMDIPIDNALADPYGNDEQQLYPWRGRITCYPAIDQTGSVDKTAAATAQISNFVGTAQASSFAISNTTILYAGAEYSYRRMILHYAKLVKAAGDVDAFLVGSELRGLTSIRGANNVFPFVEALKYLAADVRQIIGSNTKISYAADWSEYFGYHPTDNSGDLFYNLDTLWASPAIDAVAIDNYMPLSDWRDAGDPVNKTVKTSYDIDYLKSNILGGEGYDWYYENDTDRHAGTRTEITDGLNEPWVYRFKDIRSWWLNEHYERIGGVRTQSPTAWVPTKKPIWFTEVGCPAVDRGANQPNVFYDPKSSESKLPYASSGNRDDLIQHRYIKSYLEFWSGDQDIFEDANPVSTHFSGRMIDTSNIWLWAWDARPFPVFPLDQSIWSDGSNWSKGHWLNGRLGGCPVDDLLRNIFKDFGFENVEIKVDGYVDGYVLSQGGSLKTAVEPLLSFFNISLREDDGAYVMLGKNYLQQLHIEQDDLVQEDDLAALTFIRGNEVELPREMHVRHGEVFSDFESTNSYSRRIETISDRQMSVDLAVNMSKEVAISMADARIRDIWNARDSAKFGLSQKYLHLDVADLIQFNGDSFKYQIVSSAQGLYRECEGSGIDFFEDSVPVLEDVITPQKIEIAGGKPYPVFMNLPLHQNTLSPQPFIYVALSAKPWRHNYAIQSSPTDEGYSLRETVNQPSSVFELIAPLQVGPVGRWDYKNKIHIKTVGEILQSVEEILLFSGENTLAVETREGDWEIVQFLNAELVGENEWLLSSLLRGQLGTDFETLQGADIGANVVLVDASITKIDMLQYEVGLPLNWLVGAASTPVSNKTHEKAIFSCAGINARPLRPVHGKHTEALSGDIILNWIRRSRMNADTWEVPLTPLDEQNERYQVLVLNSFNEVIRQAEVSQASFLYTNEFRTADFGQTQSSVTFHISQLSDTGITGPALIVSH